MGLDIWFAEDIRNALLAANEGGDPSLQLIETFLFYVEASRRAGTVTAVTEAYKAGHSAALVTVALAFGLLPVLSELKE